jgi:hypothetical protein
MSDDFGCADVCGYYACLGWDQHCSPNETDPTKLVLIFGTQLIWRGKGRSEFCVLEADREPPR